MLIGCYQIWSDNVCGDLCNRGFPAKTNQNMCPCVQTVRNLVRGRGKFNVCEEIIVKNYLKKTVSEKTTKAAWTSHQAGISEKASQETKIYLVFSCNKQRSKKI